MTAGGLRAGGGRPPSAVSRRRDRAKAAGVVSPTLSRRGSLVVEPIDGTTLLPAWGRGGNPPAWPLSKASARERQVWRREWKRPQAVAWEALGLEELVAAYVRTLVRFEEPASPVGLGTQVRQLADSLGLSAPGLRMLRWRIVSVAAVEQPPRQEVERDDNYVLPRDRLSVAPPAPQLPPVKERFKFVAPPGGWANNTGGAAG